MRYSNAFSSFELICVIIIFAILTSFSVRYVNNIKDISCVLKLKSSLTHVQRRLSQYYAQTFLASVEIEPHIARGILATLPNDVDCGFEVQSNALIGFIGKARLHFYIEPANLAYNPRIFCALQDSFCKQMSDRNLDK